MTSHTPDPFEQRLQDAISELAADENREPVPDSVLTKVMRGVWSDVRRARTLPLSDVLGAAFVAHHVATAVVERALEPLTDVQFRSSTVHLSQDADHGEVSVQIAVAIRYGTDLTDSTGRARGVIRDTMVEQFGWVARTVDIDVVDVLVTGDDHDQR